MIALLVIMFVYCVHGNMFTSLYLILWVCLVPTHHFVISLSADPHVLDVDSKRFLRVCAVFCITALPPH